MATEKFVSQSNLQHFWDNLSPMLDKKVDITKIASATELGLVKVDGRTIKNENGLISVVYGKTAGTAVEGNDARLSDKRDPNAHTHGNITDDGKITAAAATIASGNKLVITDGDNKIQAALAFGTATNKYLTEAGTWKTIDVMSGATASAAGTAGLVPAPAAGAQTKFLRGDGTYAVPTDNKVQMTPNAAAKAYLLGTTSATETTGTAVFDTGVYIDTTAGSLVAKSVTADSFTGLASKATADKNGKEITEYLSALSVNGTTITYTKGDGTTGTIDTQDTQYVDFTGATSNAAGTHGLVPAPKAGDQSKVLTGDGKWTALPASTKLNTIAYDGDGNGVTAAAVSADGHTLTLTKGLTFLTEHPAITMGEDASKTATPAFGGKVSVVTGVTVDANGHQTAKEVTEITIPSATATDEADGLMSKGDHAKLGAFQTADKYALKSDIVGMYRFKGTVATYAELPSDAEAGDVYNVTSEKGQNYAMTDDGTWDALGEVFTIDAMDNKEIDKIMGVTTV